MSGALVGTLLPLLAACLVVGLPRRHHHHNHDWDEKVYDQRQNGSGNLRLHIDGVVMVHAPAESLAVLAAASDTTDFEQQLTALLGSIGEGSSTTTTTTTRRPAEATPVSITEVSMSDSPEGDSSDKPQNNEGDSDKPQKDEKDSDKPQKDQDSDKPQKDQKDGVYFTYKPQGDEGESSDKPQTDKEVSKEKPQKDKDVSDYKPPQKGVYVSDYKPQKDEGDHTEKPAKEKRQHQLLSSFLIPLLGRLH